MSSNGFVGFTIDLDRLIFRLNQNLWFSESSGTTRPIPVSIEPIQKPKIRYITAGDQNDLAAEAKIIKQSKKDAVEGILCSYPFVSSQFKEDFHVLMNITVAYVQIADPLSSKKRALNVERNEQEEALTSKYLSRDNRFYKDADGEYNIFNSLDQYARKVVSESVKRQKYQQIEPLRPEIICEELTESELNKVYRECLEEINLSSTVEGKIKFSIDDSKVTSDEVRARRVEYKINQHSFEIKCNLFNFDSLTLNAQNELSSLINNGKINTECLSPIEKLQLFPLVNLFNFNMLSHFEKSEFDAFIECRKNNRELSAYESEHFLYLARKSSRRGILDFSARKELQQKERLAHEMGCPDILFGEDKAARDFYLFLLKRKPGDLINLSDLGEFSKKQLYSLLVCSGVTGSCFDEFSEEEQAHFDQFGEFKEVKGLSDYAKRQFSYFVDSVSTNQLTAQRVQKEIECEDIVEIRPAIFEKTLKYEISCLRFPSAYSIFLLLKDKQVTVLPSSSQYDGKKQFLLTKDELMKLNQALTFIQEQINVYRNSLLDILEGEEAVSGVLARGSKSLAEIRSEEIKKRDRSQGKGLQMTPKVLESLSRDVTTRIVLHGTCALDLSNYADRDLIRRLQMASYVLSGCTSWDGRVKRFQRDNKYASNQNSAEIQKNHQQMKRTVVLVNLCIKNGEVDALKEVLSDETRLLTLMKDHHIAKFFNLLDAIGAPNKPIIKEKVVIQGMKTHIDWDVKFGDELEELRTRCTDQAEQIRSGISAKLVEKLATVFGLNGDIRIKFIAHLRSRGFKSEDTPNQEDRSKNLQILCAFLKEYSGGEISRLALSQLQRFTTFVQEAHESCTLNELQWLLEDLRLDWLEVVNKWLFRQIVNEYIKAHTVSSSKQVEPSQQEIIALYGATPRRIDPLTATTITALFNKLRSLPIVQKIAGKTPGIAIAINEWEKECKERIKNSIYLAKELSHNPFYGRTLIDTSWKYLETLVAKIAYQPKCNVSDASIEEMFLKLAQQVSENPNNECSQGFAGRVQGLLLMLSRSAKNDLEDHLKHVDANTSLTVYDAASSYILERFQEYNRSPNDQRMYKLLQLLNFGDTEEELDRDYRVNSDKEQAWQSALFEHKLPEKLLCHLIKTQFLTTDFGAFALIIAGN